MPNCQKKEATLDIWKESKYSLKSQNFLLDGAKHKFPKNLNLTFNYEN